MGRVYFKEDKCKGCRLCVISCPKNIITLSEKLNSKGYHPATVHEGNMKECTACASCARMCPDIAIKVEK